MNQPITPPDLQALASKISANVPKPEPGPNVTRFAILGKQHLMGELQANIEAMPEVPSEYKALIASELDKKMSAAARVDLHVIDHGNGDTSIHAHIKQIHLG